MSPCILTVDDSSTMRQMITFTLKGANFEVVEAAMVSRPWRSLRARSSPSSSRT